MAGAVAGAVAGAADTAFRPLPFPELLADGKKRREKDHTNYNCIRHIVSVLVFNQVCRERNALLSR